MFAVSNIYAYRVSAYRVLYDVKKINFRHTYGAYICTHYCFFKYLEQLNFAEAD